MPARCNDIMENGNIESECGRHVTQSRTVYVKAGDVVKHFERLPSLRDIRVTGGPDIFPYEFLQAAGQDRVLLLSRHRRRARYRQGDLEARVYDGGKGALGKILKRGLVFGRVFFRILAFRPGRVLCGCMGGMLWASFMAARIRSVPLVVASHGRVATSEPWHKRLGQRIDHWCIRNADAVICHGPYLRQQVTGIGVPPEKLIEFDVGFEDVEMWGKDGCDDLLGCRGDDNEIILFVGRIETEKGVFDLLDACAERLRSDGRVELVYAGDGAQLGRLRESVHRLGLRGRVRLLGQVDYERLGAVIAASTILVTPTRSDFPEGRCMAAMEGLVMGVPVIGPDSGPFPYLIEDGVNGLLFRTDSVEDLRHTIMRVLDDRELYERLRRGTQHAGKNLIRPQRTFGQAVQEAFRMAADG